MGYSKPAIKAIRLEPHRELMDTSFPNSGGHNKADDGDDLSAKQGWFDEDEEDAPQQWSI